MFIGTFLMGILSVIVGTIIGFVIGKLFSSNLPDICKGWNKYYVMELSLFLTGALVHILFESFGLGKIYSMGGNSCLN